MSRAADRPDGSDEAKAGGREAAAWPLHIVSSGVCQYVDDLSPPLLALRMAWWLMRAGA